MLPSFEEMYRPILVELTCKSFGIDVPLDDIRKSIIDWFRITDEELSQLTTGERKRKADAPQPPAVELFGKRLEWALSDLRKAGLIWRTKYTNCWYGGNAAKSLLNHITDEYANRVFTRTNLVGYSRKFRTEAAHHRPVDCL